MADSTIFPNIKIGERFYSSTMGTLVEVIKIDHNKYKLFLTKSLIDKLITTYAFDITGNWVRLKIKTNRMKFHKPSIALDSRYWRLTLKL